MNEQQAKDAFKAGHLQPRCPGCDQSILILGKKVQMNEKGTYNTILAAAYQCANCQERFVAYIGAPTNGEQAKG